MCTISFLPTGPGSYLLASNRDERKTREPALSPERHVAGKTPCLWPTDGKAGGTWIAVNEHRVAFALLNDYSNTKQAWDTNNGSPVTHHETRSRGIIIPEIADCKTGNEVNTRFRKSEHLQSLAFQPFQLLMTSPDQGVHLWHYDGVTLQDRHQAYGAGLWVSAGRNESRIRACRQKLFESHLGKSYSDDLQRIKDLHTFQESGIGPCGFSMQLEKVQTVSSTIIECDTDGNIRMHYMSGLPSPQKKWQIHAL